jgi:hypothetical protein
MVNRHRIKTMRIYSSTYNDAYTWQCYTCAAIASTHQWGFKNGDLLNLAYMLEK